MTTDPVGVGEDSTECFRRSSDLACSCDLCGAGVVGLIDKRTALLHCLVCWRAKYEPPSAQQLRLFEVDDELASESTSSPRFVPLVASNEEGWTEMQCDTCDDFLLDRWYDKRDQEEGV